MEQSRSIDAERARCRSAAQMQDALGTLEGRWKMMILAHLFSEEVMRFSDLQRAIPKVSQKMLIQQLRGLESDGVISRTVHPQVPPKVEYRLTELGRGLAPVFLALQDWVELRRGIGDAMREA
ncbi:MAG TPA: helix-turn-helix domain-containing protein [Caulobacteraceae bacterium]|jgi:DNA-binding HxlR family transcriptional regulator|nr:helix-turn-helix domain-containing protein [Caulobacteraceae bacterium]